MTKEITAALCKFIQEVGTIQEKSEAQYDKFADLSTVLSVVNPALAANGLIVTNTTKIVAVSYTHLTLPTILRV